MLFTVRPNYNSTTLQLQLQPHYATLHPAVVGEVTTHATIAATLHPPFRPSVDSLCHPCITKTNLSYKFPILKLPPRPCAVLLVQLCVIFTYIPTYLHTYYLHTYTPAYPPTYLRTYLHTYIRTYLHTRIPAFLHFCILHTCIPTYLHPYTYVPRSPLFVICRWIDWELKNKRPSCSRSHSIPSYLSCFRHSSQVKSFNRETIAEMNVSSVIYAWKAKGDTERKTETN